MDKTVCDKCADKSVWREVEYLLNSDTVEELSSNSS